MNTDYLYSGKIKDVSETEMRFLIFILVLCTLVFSCNEKTSKRKVGFPVGKQVKVLVAFDTIQLSDSESVEISKKYSEEYKPVTTDNKRVAELTHVPDSVIAAFKHLRQIKKVTAEQYLTLVFLKLYRSHLQCCNQSYDLRAKWNLYIDSVADPLLYEYVALTETYSLYQPIEFISSGLPTRVVELHSYLLKSPKIKKEYLQIQKKENRIRKGVF